MEEKRFMSVGKISKTFVVICVLMQRRKKTEVFSVVVKKYARLVSLKNMITRFVKNFTKTFVI